MGVVKLRERHVLGPAGHPCLLCGHAEVFVIESRNVRRLRDRLSPSWDPRIRVTESCNKCGARLYTMHDNVVRES